MTTFPQAPTSININSSYTAHTERTFEIQCPEGKLTNASVLNEAGDLEFALKTKPFLTSWSVRRSLNDKSGQHLLDLRHYKSKLGQWEIQDTKGKQLCLVKDGQLPGQNITDVTAQLHTEASYATVSMKSSDHAGTTTVFDVDGVPFAELTLTANNDVSFLKTRGLMRTTWKLQVAAEADLALVLAMVFCRIEINHMWRR